MINNKILKKIKKSKFNSLFKQLDWIILNFGDSIKYSLHVACNVRICHRDKVVLNTSDEFFTKEGIQKTEEVYERLEKEGFIYDPDSLLAENIKKVNKLLDGKTPRRVKVSKWKDLIIKFADQIEIQIIPDCLERDYEYYRFIEFIPHYNDDPLKCTSIHYVVCNDQGVPKLKIDQ